MYLLEDGTVRRDGSGWLKNYIVENVEITGTVRDEKGKPWLKVDALRLTGTEK